MSGLVREAGSGREPEARMDKMAACDRLGVRRVVSH